MNLSTRILNILRAGSRRAVNRSPRSGRFRPALEALECRLAPAATPVSVNTNNTAVGDFASGDPYFVLDSAVTSSDGRYAAFISQATNLLSTSAGSPPGTPTTVQTFWRDTLTGETRRIGLVAGSRPSISADGRFVAFTAGQLAKPMDGSQECIYLYDSQMDTTQNVGQFTSGSGLFLPYTLSPDGRYVGFVGATILGEGIGVGTSVRLWDRLASHDNASPVRDWFFNTLSLTAGDLNSSFLGYTFGDGSRQMPTGDIHTGGTLNDNSNKVLMFSGDSQTVVFSTGAPNSVEFLAPGVSDTNKEGDVYAYSIPTGVTTEVSVTNAGIAAGNKGSGLFSVSNDGNLVLFRSAATDLDPTNPTEPFRDDLYVRNRSAGTTVMVSTNGVRSDGTQGNVSGNGRYVVFASGVGLVPKAGAGVYRKDLQTGAIELVDVKPDGTPSVQGVLISQQISAAGVIPQAISADGRFIAWASTATDLVVGGLTNSFASGRLFIYVRDMTLGITTLMSSTAAGPTTGQDKDTAYHPIISADGKVVYFVSAASDLTTLTNLNNARQVYRADVPVIVDPTAPTSAVTFPSQPFYNATSWTGTLTGTSSDNPGGTGVKSVGVSISDGSLFWNGTGFSSPTPVFNATTLGAGGAWTYAFLASNLTNGKSYTVQSQATDKIGNVETAGTGASFAFDTSTPTSSVTFPSQPFYNGTSWTGTLTGTSSDGAGGSGVSSVGVSISTGGLFWDGSAFASSSPVFNATTLGADGSWSYPFPASNLADGKSYSVKSVAKDRAGNVETAGAGASFTFDTTGPTVNITSGPGATLAGNSATFVFSGSDAVSVASALTFSTSLDSGAFATATSPVTVSGLAPGSHTFRVRATDQVGNVGTATTSTFSVINPSGIGAFDSASGTWYLRNERSAGPPDAGKFDYGLPNWGGVVGDWNGDGTTSVGVVNPLGKFAQWYLRNENSAGAADAPATPFFFGLPTWVPLAGDWDGDGVTGIGMFDPVSFTWYLENTPGSGKVDVQFQYGFPGWIPVVGNWNGSGGDGIGLYDPVNVTFYLRNQASAGDPDAGKFAYGFNGWLPLSGDWNGDGQDTVGLFDPSQATWYLRNQNNAGDPDAGKFAYGFFSWKPVSGAWTAGAASAGMEASLPAPTPASPSVSGAEAPVPAAYQDAVVVDALARLEGRQDHRAADLVFSAGL